MLMAFTFLTVYSVPGNSDVKKNAIYAESNKNLNDYIMSCHIGIAITDQIMNNETSAKH